MFPAVVATLKKRNLLNERGLSTYGWDVLNQFRIKRAIILAAGISSRFVPICFDKPKGLLHVRGEVLVERQIRQLLTRGIKDITLVVGRFSEQFEYLSSRFDVRLIFNPNYAVKNNFASVYAAREHIDDAIVSSADLYFSRNLFPTYAFDSFYSCIYQAGPTDERCVDLDDDDCIKRTYYGGGDSWVTFGFAFFSRAFAKSYINLAKPLLDDPLYARSFWADIQDKYLKELPMRVLRCSGNDIHEFDTLEELWAFDPDFEGTRESIFMHSLCSRLQCNERELSLFRPIMQGNDLRGVSFRYRGVSCQFEVDTQIITIHES